MYASFKLNTSKYTDITLKVYADTQKPRLTPVMSNEGEVMAWDILLTCVKLAERHQTGGVDG